MVAVKLETAQGNNTDNTTIVTTETATATESHTTNHHKRKKDRSDSDKLNKKKRARATHLPDTIKKEIKKQIHGKVKNDNDNSRPDLSHIISDCVIFISNLNKEITTEDILQNIFNQYGSISFIRILRNKKLQSRGFAYIVYNDTTSANNALQHNDKVVDNNTIKVEISAKPVDFVYNLPHTKQFKIEPARKLNKEERKQLQSEYDKYEYAVKYATEHNLPLPTKKFNPLEHRKIIRNDNTWQYVVSQKPFNCMTVYITNLAYNTTENDIRKKFEHAGNITYLNLCKHDDGKLKGFAYVQYDNTDATDIAIKENETDLCGRRIRVDYARPLRERYKNHLTYKPRRDSHTNSNIRSNDTTNRKSVFSQHADNVNNQ